MATKFKNGIDVTSTSVVTAANATDIPLTVKATNTATGTSSWTGSVSSITVTGVTGTISAGLYVSGSNIAAGTIVTSATNNAGTWTVGLNTPTNTTQSSTTLYFSQSANIQEWDAPANNATVTSASSTSTTLTYNANNSFSAGQLVTVTGMSVAGYNVTNAIINTASSTQFTILSAANPGTASGQTGAATISLITINNGGRLTSSAPLWISGGVSTTSDTVTDAALVIPVNRYIYTTPNSTTISNAGQRRLLGMSNGTLTAGGYTFAANGLQLGPGSTAQVNYLWFSPGSTNIANYGLSGVNAGSMFVFNPSSFHNGYGTAITETGVLSTTELLASGSWTSTGWTAGSSISIASVSTSGGAVTYTTASNHGYVKDQTALVSGSTPSGYNTTASTGQIIGVPSSTTFVVLNATTAAYTANSGSVNSYTYTRSANAGALVNSNAPSINTSYQVTYFITGLATGQSVTIALGGQSTTISGSAAGATTTATATSGAGQTSFTVSSATGISVHAIVSGTGIPTGTKVTSVSGTTVTVDTPTNSSWVSGGSLTFTPSASGIWGPRMPNSLTSYTVPASTGQTGGQSSTGLVVHTSGNTEWTGTITLSARAITSSIPSMMIVDSTNSPAIEIRTSTTALSGGPSFSPRNIFIGRESGKFAVQNGTRAGSTGPANITSVFGYGNTALGDTSLSNLTTGPLNTAIGGFSLAANTTGGFNTGLGYGTLNQSTTAGNNTAAGYFASYGNTTGSNNTAVGFQSLFSNTTSSSNVAVGYFAGSQTTGGSNTAVGGQALQGQSGQTSGSNNVAVGQQSLLVATTGNANTAVGQGTLLQNTTGLQNTNIGYISGNNLTSGSFNTFLGSQTGTSTLSQPNNVNYSAAIGYLAATSTSNQMVVGNPSTILGINQNKLHGELVVGGGVSGSLTLPYRAVTGNTTLTYTDYTVDCNIASPGTITVTLPSAGTTATTTATQATVGSYSITVGSTTNITVGSIVASPAPTGIPAGAMVQAVTGTTNGTVSLNTPTTGSLSSASITFVQQTTASANATVGRIYNIKNSGTGTITVQRSGTDLIDGATSFSLNAQYQSITVQSTGTGWIIL